MENDSTAVVKLECWFSNSNKGGKYFSKDASGTYSLKEERPKIKTSDKDIFGKDGLLDIGSQIKMISKFKNLCKGSCKYFNERGKNPKISENFLKYLDKIWTDYFAKKYGNVTKINNIQKETIRLEKAYTYDKSDKHKKSAYFESKISTFKALTARLMSSSQFIVNNSNLSSPPNLTEDEPNAIKNTHKTKLSQPVHTQGNFFQSGEVRQISNKSQVPVNASLQHAPKGGTLTLNLRKSSSNLRTKSSPSPSQPNGNRLVRRNDKD